MAEAAEANSTTRRAFLATAAVISTFLAPTIAATSTDMIDKAMPELVLRMPPSINPDLISLGRKIDDVLTRYYDCEAVSTEARKAFKEWQRRNPRPPTGCSAHVEREQGVMRQIGLARTQSDVNEALKEHGRLAREFAKLSATNMDEVEYKARIAMMMDDHDGVMSRSALFDLVKLRTSKT